MLTQALFLTIHSDYEQLVDVCANDVDNDRPLRAVDFRLLGY